MEWNGIEHISSQSVLTMLLYQVKTHTVKKNRSSVRG